MSTDRKPPISTPESLQRPAYGDEMSQEKAIPAPTAPMGDVNPSVIAAVVAATLQALGVAPGTSLAASQNAVAEAKKPEINVKTIVVQMRALTHARDKTGVIWRYEQKGRYRVSLEVAEQWVNNRLAVLDGMPMHLEDKFQGYAGIVSARQADAPEAGSGSDATPEWQQRPDEASIPMSANSDQGFLVRRELSPKFVENADAAPGFVADLRRQAAQIAAARA